MADEDPLAPTAEQLKMMDQAEKKIRDEIKKTLDTAIKEHQHGQSTEYAIVAALSTLMDYCHEHSFALRTDFEGMVNMTHDARERTADPSLPPAGVGLPEHLQPGPHPDKDLLAQIQYIHENQLTERDHLVREQMEETRRLGESRDRTLFHEAQIDDQNKRFSEQVEESISRYYEAKKIEREMQQERVAQHSIKMSI